MNNRYAHGEPIKGELHVADASTATAIPIYNVGSLTARTLAVDEYVRIVSITVVTDTAADVVVFFGTNTTPDAGETIIRGTFGANGGVAQANIDVATRIGDTIYVKSSIAAVVDVNFEGGIHVEGSIKPRPTWRESLIPGA